MNDASIVVQRPAGRPAALVLLFHGVGGEPRDLLPLGQRVASADPAAFVVCVAAPEASGLSRGRQWFAVAGVTEANRPGRVAAAMPAFEAAVAGWQREAGAEAAETVLIGFSQGAIMALESTQRPHALSARVVALAGRFAVLPHRPPAAIVHLVHGTADAVMPSALSEQAATHIRRLGGPVTLDLVPGLGHDIDERAVRCLLGRLARGAHRAVAT